jgi:hypothetical protein
MIYQDKFDHYLTSGRISGSMGELDRLNYDGLIIIDCD